MIWEAVLWTLLEVGDSVELPVEWVVPTKWVAWYRLQVTNFGYPIIGAMRQWGSPAGWSFLVFVWIVGITITALAFGLRTARALRDWVF